MLTEKIRSSRIGALVQGRVRLIAILAVLGMCAPSWFLAETGEVSLSCENGREGNHISCILANGLSEDVLWLASPFVLEGPLGADGYFYMFVGGERIENTLEYGLATVGGLGGPILFKPTVHLSETDLARLYRLGAGDNVVFGIRRNSAPRANLDKPLEWLFRAKVVVAKVYGLASMIKNHQVASECADRLRLGLTFRPVPAEIGVRESPYAILGQRGSESVTGPPARPRRPRYESDGCRDRISGQFEHVYSNELRADWSW